MSETEPLFFNTHALVKKLIASGMPEAQAEAQMEIFIQFIDDRLATKTSVKNLEFTLKKDIKELESNLMKDMKELDTNLRRDLKILEKDIIIKLGSMIVVSTTLLAVLIKIL